LGENGPKPARQCRLSKDWTAVRERRQGEVGNRAGLNRERNKCSRAEARTLDIREGKDAGEEL